MTHPIEAAEAELPERDTAKPAEQQGLFRKFTVTRTDGSSEPGGKHHGCEYFVLDVDHDPHAAAALAAYADAVEPTHPLLAADMRKRYGLAALRAALPALREVPAGWTRQRHIALREAHCWPALGAYFDARPVHDGAMPRRAFEAGFERGFDKAAELLAAAPPAPSVREVEPVDPGERRIEQAPRALNGNDRAYWVLGWNECREAFLSPASSPRVAAPPAPAQPAQGGGVVVDEVAWHGFIKDYERYASGDLKMPFSELRISLSAVIESATPAPAAPDEPGAGVVEALSAFKAGLLHDIEEPDDELLAEFQRAFVQQLQRRKHKPHLESAEKAGARAMFKLAVSRERAALAAQTDGQGAPK